MTPEELRTREAARLHAVFAEAAPLASLDGSIVLAALQAPRPATALDVLRSLTAPLVAAGQMDPEAAEAALHELAQREVARRAMSAVNARRR